MFGVDKAARGHHSLLDRYARDEPLSGLSFNFITSALLQRIVMHVRPQVAQHFLYQSALAAATPVLMTLLKRLIASIV